MALIDHIARNIRLARERLGWSREELAARSDLPVSMVAQMEQGGPVDFSELHSIVLALNVDLQELLDADDSSSGSD